MNKRFSAVVLAAGESARVGCNKLELTLGGRSVLEHVIDHFLIDSVIEIVVVTGKFSSELQFKNISPLIRFVHNPNYAQGMGSSVKKGIESLSIIPDAFFITPADMPAIRKETIHNMAETFKDHNIVIPTYQGKKGHPVLLDKIFIEQCLNEKKEKVLYEVIEKNKNRIDFIPVEDEGILMDIDRMEDYEKLKKYYNDPLNK